MTDLEMFFRQSDSHWQINKFFHYFDIYDYHFNRYRNKEVIILEIGVDHGGSLQMWKNYFGNKAKIYGIDINPACKNLEEENIEIFIGSQSDKLFLENVKSKIPPIDILIDDGGHMMYQQITSFEVLFDHIKNNGIYLCEDLHTSYWVNMGGGHKRKGTFIEYSKNLIDYLNAYHSRQKSLNVNKYTKTINSLHYYDSILVIEKAKRHKPSSQIIGNLPFSNNSPMDTRLNWKKRLSHTIMFNKTITCINKALRFCGLKNLYYIWYVEPEKTNDKHNG
jgi:23S rRNA U2552 (ribose-2'-O)-methylase RlmE/FtsJ